jgi:flagellar hook-length control protein FliK
MGKLTLRIETENNHVTAWISTDNDQVKTLLAQNSPVLRQHLQEQGLMLGQFLVDVRQEKGNQHYPQQNRTARRNPRNVSAISGAEADDTKAGPGRKAYRPGSDDQLISFFA